MGIFEIYLLEVRRMNTIPPGLVGLRLRPGVETPGYSQLSLRDSFSPGAGADADKVGSGERLGWAADTGEKFSIET